jgi:hypothetical protein
MDIGSILVALRNEKQRLDTAIAALEGLEPPRSTRGRGMNGRRRRHMSAAARKRISAAMKARWAARRKKNAAA